MRIEPCYGFIVNYFVLLRYTRPSSHKGKREGSDEMLMMLPFLSGALAVWFGILGKRRPCFALWLVTLAVFAVGAHRYMTGPVPLPLAL